MSMPRPFVPWPAKVLRSPAARVERVDDEVRAIWDEMIMAMRSMPGVGLAAPQLGISRALAVVDCSDGAGPVIRMANPKLLSASAEMQEHQEGSPNLPDVWAKISRPARVTISYLDETGTETTRELTELWATSAQHQIDHLEGRMFFDRLSPLKRKMLIAKSQKKAKR